VRGGSPVAALDDSTPFRAILQGYFNWLSVCGKFAQNRHPEGLSANRQTFAGCSQTPVARTATVLNYTPFWIHSRLSAGNRIVTMNS
jgi:hypothetical protein